jgi:hypothetical protein
MVRCWNPFEFNGLGTGLLEQQDAETYDQRGRAEYDGDQRLFRTLFELVFHRSRTHRILFCSRGVHKIGGDWTGRRPLDPYQDPRSLPHARY